jgi:hypothetical protein
MIRPRKRSLSEVNVQQLINPAAALLAAVPESNGSPSSYHIPTLPVYLHRAKHALTCLQQGPTTHPSTNPMLREVQAVHEAVKGLATSPASSPVSRTRHGLRSRPPFRRHRRGTRSPTSPFQGLELTIPVSDTEERKKEGTKSANLGDHT